MQHIAEFFEQGGFFMYVNVVCSAIAIAMIAERTFFFINRGGVNAKSFLEQIRSFIAANNVDRAIKMSSGSNAPLARVAKAGLSKLSKGEGAMTTAIEETLVDVMPELKKRIGALWSIANIATLIGLLGTITGLIGAFGAVAKAAAADRSTILSAKISEAMNNTWLGLAIAVSCMIGHVFLNAASKSQQQELESFAMKLENLLAETLRAGNRA